MVFVQMLHRKKMMRFWGCGMMEGESRDSPFKFIILYIMVK